MSRRSLSLVFGAVNPNDVEHIFLPGNMRWRRFRTPAFSSDPAGYTLLEVMVAVAIIAIALTALLGSQGQSVSLAGEAQLATTAPLLAQAKMAELAVAVGQQGVLGGDEGDFGDDFPGFRWQVTRRDLPASIAAGCGDFLQGVDVVVTWGTPVRYRYELTSYLFVSPKQ